MMRNSFQCTIILISILCLVCEALFAAQTIQGNDADVIASVFTRYSTLLGQKGWITHVDGNSIKAFRFNADYDEVRAYIQAVNKNSFTTFEVEITKNEISHKKSFKFQNNSADYRHKAEIALTAHMLAATLEPSRTTPKNPHFMRFSGGYSRTGDDTDVFPEKKKGGYYLAMNYTYDPSRLTDLDRTHLSFGDYLIIDAWAVFDSNPKNRNYVNENFFNFDIIFYGTHRKDGTAQSGFRFVYGFYTGMEYFRPGWKDNILLWSYDLYREQPHIQYLIWRALGWGFTGNWYTSSGIYSLSCMAGLGPSFNSSLFAIGWGPDEELSRSPIFQSLNGSKQNYYYSTAYPVSVSIRADKLWRFRFSCTYNFCFFYASDPEQKNEEVYDILQILKPSVAFYASEKVLVQLNYERWYIHSMLNGDHLSHSWNRLCLDVTYIVQ